MGLRQSKHLDSSVSESSRNDQDQIFIKGKLVQSPKIMSVSEINQVYQEKRTRELKQLREQMTDFLNKCFFKIAQQIQQSYQTEFVYQFRIITAYLSRKEIDHHLIKLVQKNLEIKQWFVELAHDPYGAHMKNSLEQNFRLTPKLETHFIPGTHSIFNYNIIIQMINFREKTKKEAFTKYAPSFFYQTTERIFPAEICVVCQEESPSQIFNPCGHLCTCTSCHQNLNYPKKCPLCSYPIHDFRQVTNDELTKFVTDHQETELNDKDEKK